MLKIYYIILTKVLRKSSKLVKNRLIDTYYTEHNWKSYIRLSINIMMRQDPEILDFYFLLLHTQKIASKCILL